MPPAAVAATAATRALVRATHGANGGATGNRGGTGKHRRPGRGDVSRRQARGRDGAYGATPERWRAETGGRGGGRVWDTERRGRRERGGEAGRRGSGGWGGQTDGWAGGRGGQWWWGDTHRPRHCRSARTGATRAGDPRVPPRDPRRDGNVDGRRARQPAQEPKDFFPITRKSLDIHKRHENSSALRLYIRI